MRRIGIGVIGGGYMGKAHSVAMNAVGCGLRHKAPAPLRNDLHDNGGGSRPQGSGTRLFDRSTSDWRVLVDDPAVEAIIIATPQHTHLDIALAAFERGKAVFCEKPMGWDCMKPGRWLLLQNRAARSICAVSTTSARPASQLARQMIEAGEIGDITYFRGEHTEDFFADPAEPATWRVFGQANGTMGDLAPHMINGALALAGPIRSLVADIETVHARRPSEDGDVEVTNDDHGQFLCRFDSGAMGALYFSRVATGRKMGYAYDIYGTKGGLRFDQEDQNALWYYDGAAPKGARGLHQAADRSTAPGL